MDIATRPCAGRRAAAPRAWTARLANYYRAARVADALVVNAGSVTSLRCAPFGILVLRILLAAGTALKQRASFDNIGGLFKPSYNALILPRMYADGGLACRRLHIRITSGLLAQTFSVNVYEVFARLYSSQDYAQAHNTPANWLPRFAAASRAWLAVCATLRVSRA